MSISKEGTWKKYNNIVCPRYLLLRSCAGFPVGGVSTWQNIIARERERGERGGREGDGERREGGRGRERERVNE